MVTNFPNKVSASFHSPQPGFLRPTSAAKRLATLKPYLDADVYQSYVDIFGIFQGAVRNIFVGHNELVPRLATLCSATVGKDIALSTRSTYYKLHQSSLFDPDTLPVHLHRIYHSLHDSIDPLLELEPHQLFGPYRRDMLMGYVIHLVVFNLGILYTLVPVIVHWLQEELRQHHSGALMAFSSILFLQFWRFDETYHPDYDGDFLGHLDASKKIDNNIVFWQLYLIGYWKNTITDLHVRSRIGGYHSLMVEALARPLRVLETHTLEVFQALDHIKECPHHPSINLALCNVLRKLVVDVRSNRNPSLHYQLILRFIAVWLSFPQSVTQVVYNSLLPGNLFLFRSLLSVIKFVMAVAENDTLRHKLSNCLTTVKILLHFYLDNGQHEDTSGFVECFFEFQTASTGRNESFDEFVDWLHDQNSAYRQLGEELSRRFYKRGVDMEYVDVDE